MRNTIKIIDLLNKIANGEKPPKRIKYQIYSFEFNGRTYIDDENDSITEYLLSDLSNINSEVEILDEEDEFEDIEEITCEGEKIELGSLNKWLTSTMNDNECKMCSAIECLGMELNRVIKNQKKIIDKLKEM